MKELEQLLAVRRPFLLDAGVRRVAFHQIQEELDWLEMAVPRKGE